MKIHIARSINRSIAEILTPIRRIGNFGRRQNRFHFSRQSNKCIDHVKVGCRRTERHQPAHLAANQKRLNPARRRTQFCIMQNHAAVSPLRGAGINHTRTRHGKIRRHTTAHESVALRHHCRCLVNGSRQSRRHTARHIPPPRISRLCRPSIRIRQAVARRNIHQQKRIERYRQSTRTQILYGPHDRFIRWRATKGRRSPAVARRHRSGPRFS